MPQPPWTKSLPHNQQIYQVIELKENFFSNFQDCLSWKSQQRFLFSSLPKVMPSLVFYNVICMALF